MDYNNHYTRLIDRAKNRKLTGYAEKHHIIPRCLGGGDDVVNITKLTAREHFIAHLLLIKIHPNNIKLIFALNMMCCKSWANTHRTHNRMYGWLREEFAKSMSFIQEGKKNSQYGTCWIFNTTIKKSKKIPKDKLEQFIIDGWQKGRVMDFDEYEIKKKRAICLQQQKLNKKQNVHKKISTIRHRTCRRCDHVVCERPSICSRPRMINTLVKYFGFNKDIIGTYNIYEEYDRVVNIIRTEYEVNKLSTTEIVKKYNITSTQRLDYIFKFIGIKARTFKEALNNFHKNK